MIPTFTAHGHCVVAPDLIGFGKSDKFKKANFIQQLQLNCTARNLALWTKYTGVDPETSLTGAGSSIGGFDYFNNPGTRSFIFSAKLVF